MDLNRLYDALHFFAHRGTFEILSALEQKPYRHGALTREVLQYIPSANTVNETLRRLVEAGLVAHEDVWYSLTDRGREVLPLTTEYVKSLGWWDDERSNKTHARDG